MLYKKNDTVKLNADLFKNPTSEYRAAPFWAWNGKLDQEELNWQLDVLKKMGFGGAHLHVRTGMSTPYLSDEYMRFIKDTVQKAKENEMLAWLYDEDRWPSGAAGGLVTKEKRFRARYLLFTPFAYGTVAFDSLAENGAHARATRSENGELLACYDVHLNEKGELLEWKMIPETEPAEYNKWYAYLETHTERPWYNNQAYVNTLDKAAIDRFIDITYESYNRIIAEEFDQTVPAIFTDEPQFTHKSVLKYALEKADVTIPWTDDLAETYGASYPGEDLMENLPELFWDYPDERVSKLRYHYHDHVCERFANAFADNCGKWCREHGLKLTGHMMEEPTLKSQTAALGETMRSYRSFELPGIDMLCGDLEYTTAKQAQSAVRQYGREGMVSELYGVTNWDFDFRDHKFHGDWQAALGVTVRVPHLSWMTMAGEAKRDYPASINYQSPWWDKYSWVEDHFARVNTAMTRGAAVARVGVIHPIESYWLHWGPAEQSALLRENMDTNFQNITEWLLFGGIDFDFISESLLPELCSSGAVPLEVGKMKYDAIIVPGCETLRGTTYERLEGFVENGGKLIFAGKIPTLEEGEPTRRGKVLAERSECVRFEKYEILKNLEEVRDIEMRDQTGALTDNLLYQLRQDKAGRWLYIAHGKLPYNKDISRCQNLNIRIKGKWKIQKFNTENGQIEEIDQSIVSNITEVRCRLYDYDSILLWMEDCDRADSDEKKTAQMITEKQQKRVRLPETFSYSLSEPNALLLDCAEYALDDEEWNPEEEILRLDDICREKLGWPGRKIPVAQPWAIKEETIQHVVHLRFCIESEIDCSEVKLAIEDAETLKIKWNGENVKNTIIGWYADKAIKTVILPGVMKGTNILEVSIPFGKRSNIEWAYLLGEFGVSVTGKKAVIIPMPPKIAFGDITGQGLPFYGGNIVYNIPFITEGGTIQIQSNRYRGAAQSVSIDDGTENPIIYPPYKMEFKDISAGVHTLNLKLYGHRCNGFGPVHLADQKESWIGPEAWRSEGEAWCYEYVLCEEGILQTPVISIK